MRKIHTIKYILHSRITQVALISWLSCCTVFLQFLSAQSLVNIKVIATVPDVSEINVEVMNSMVIDDTKAINGLISILPTKDAEAGSIRIKGSPNSKFSLLFLSHMELENLNNSQVVQFKFKLSGSPMDNQQASLIVDPMLRDFVFNENGEYFIWVGGEMDMSTAGPGQYEGVLAFEIEYL